MATREEMQRGIQLNRDRAAMYQQIADDGGDSFWTRETAQAEATRFTGFADRLAASLAKK